MALLASMTAMAQENAKVDVHARYTKVVTPVDGKYESKRPPVEDRLFTSTAVEKKIKEVQKLLKKNPKLAWMFANCYPNTLESTVHYRVLENGDDDTFVYTGDIPAMWLRDSGAQVWPYVALANKDEKLKKMLKGVILRQLKCINIDRYANAFNDGPTGAGWVKDRTKMQPDVFERKYEIDSFCYPIRLAYEYWKVTGDDSIFGDVWMKAVENILKTFHEQQRKVTAKAYHFTRVSDRAFDTIGWDGFGAPVKPVGLIASMFRPSDDATILPFLIPSNFMAVSSMNKAAEITEQQKAAEIELAEAKAAWTAELDASPLTIDVSQIADIVSVTSGVPVSSLTESESRRLLQAESVLKTRIIGQDEAVEAVAKAVRRSRSPLKDPRRPGGSFIFLGPTGTGKTELAKTLAEYLFGSKDALISFDMSEFGSEFEVSKLIGSPPGYVGHDEGGQLTKAVRRHPYSVVLFDEIEKAHPDIFNILLQVLEEGRLTDSQGKTVDFRNTVIIMTSNVGAREIAQDASVGFGTTGEQGLTSSEIKGRAMGELKRLFRPELLNRIDDIVVFQKLTGENLTKIAHLLVDDLRQRLIANGMNIKLTDAAYDKIVAEGTDLTNGARPLRRAIQKLIEDPLSEELLAGEWGEGDTVLCDVADGKFVFSHGTGEIPAPRPAGTLGGDTAPAAPHTGNAAPVSSGVSSGPGGMMQAGSGAL